MTAVTCVINNLSRVALLAIFVGNGLAGMITLPRALFKPRCSNYTSALLAGLLLEEGLNWDVTPRRRLQPLNSG